MLLTEEKIKDYYGNENWFMDIMHKTLYEIFLYEERNHMFHSDSKKFLAGMSSKINYLINSLKVKDITKLDSFKKYQNKQLDLILKVVNFFNENENIFKKNNLVHYNEIKDVLSNDNNAHLLIEKDFLLKFLDSSLSKTKVLELYPIFFEENNLKIKNVKDKYFLDIDLDLFKNNQYIDNVFSSDMKSGTINGLFVNLLSDIADMKSLRDEHMHLFIVESILNNIFSESLLGDIKVENYEGKVIIYREGLNQTVSDLLKNSKNDRLMLMDEKNFIDFFKPISENVSNKVATLHQLFIYANKTNDVKNYENLLYGFINELLDESNCLENKSSYKEYLNLFLSFKYDDYIKKHVMNKLNVLVENKLIDNIGDILVDEALKLFENYRSKILIDKLYSGERIIDYSLISSKNIIIGVDLLNSLKIINIKNGLQLMDSSDNFSVNKKDKQMIFTVFEKDINLVDDNDLAKIIVKGIIDLSKSYEKNNKDKISICINEMQSSLRELILEKKMNNSTSEKVSKPKGKI